MLRVIALCRRFL